MTKRTFREALRHAFAVDPPGPAEPTPEERAALDPLIAEVRKRGMTRPALLFLESVRPLNGVGAQALHFMQPFATAVLDPVRYRVLSQYLERRGSIEWLALQFEDTADPPRPQADDSPGQPPVTR
jgi:hypothetical protein